jgi:hypothetical protein
LRIVIFGKEAQGLVQQVVLAIEVQIDDALGQAGFIRDVGQRQAAKALIRYALDRCIDQAVAAIENSLIYQLLKKTTIV